MSKKDDDDYYFVDLLKESVTDSDMPVGGRIATGILGLFGTVLIDPIKYGMKKLGIKDENPGPDPSDPTDPRNPGAF